jgi:hypothetical protein
VDGTKKPGGRANALLPREPLFEDAVEEAWDAALAQAARKAREAGELPGALQRLVSERLASPLNWRDLLRQFLSQTAKDDFSWVRPNRRYLHAGLFARPRDLGTGQGENSSGLCGGADTAGGEKVIQGGGSV